MDKADNDCRVEVMHSLHCLNAVRQALYPEYYENKGGHQHLAPIWQKVKEIHIGMLVFYNLRLDADNARTLR